MKKKLKSSVYDEYLSVANKITYAYISVFLFVLPLAITNAYYNITETKLCTFYVLSGLYIFIQLIVFLMFTVVKGKVFINSLNFKMGFLDIAFVLFAFSYIISAIFSPYNIADVLLGIGSRYQGVFTILLYVLLYFIITRTFSFSPRCLVWAGVSFSIVSVIAILNSVSVDPLGFYSALSAENQKLYISTIGNINFYSAYYNIMLPVLVVGFCKALDKKSLIIFGSFVVIGSVGMVFTSSESFLLGFLIAMALLLYFIMDDAKGLKRLLVCCCIFVASITIYTKIYSGGKYEALLNFEPSSLMSVLSNPVISVILILVLLIIFIVSIKKPQFLSGIKKIYLIVLVSGFVAGVIGLTLINTIFKDVNLGMFDTYLKFSDSWGTNRGQNWAFCITEFIKAPIFNKLFGYGPETYKHLTEKTDFYATKVLDQVHNEYLQYLISVGLLGLCSYLSIILSTVKSTIKTLSKNAVAMSMLCSLIAYWIQASVNIAQPFTTPIMFIFIAILSKLSVTEMIEKVK